MTSPNLKETVAEKTVTFLAAAAIGAYAMRLLFERSRLSDEFTRRDKKFLKKNNIDPDKLFEPVKGRLIS